MELDILHWKTVNWLSSGTVQIIKTRMCFTECRLVNSHHSRFLAQKEIFATKLDRSGYFSPRESSQKCSFVPKNCSGVNSQSSSRRQMSTHEEGGQASQQCSRSNWTFVGCRSTARAACGRPLARWESTPGPGTGSCSRRLTSADTAPCLVGQTWAARCEAGARRGRRRRLTALPCWTPVSRIDNRCADGRFLMSPRGMAVSNTRDLSSSETRVNAATRGWKSHLSESTWCQESIGGICFTNKWRAASLQPLTFSNTC